MPQNLGQLHCSATLCAGMLPSAWSLCCGHLAAAGIDLQISPRPSRTCVQRRLLRADQRAEEVSHGAGRTVAAAQLTGVVDREGVRALHSREISGFATRERDTWYVCSTAQAGGQQQHVGLCRLAAASHTCMQSVEARSPVPVMRQMAQSGLAGSVCSAAAWPGVDSGRTHAATAACGSAEELPELMALRLALLNAVKAALCSIANGSK